MRLLQLALISAVFEAAAALVLGGAFVPVIMFAVRLKQWSRLAAMHQAGTFWDNHWTESWESLSILILPLMVVLLTTHILQVEYRNNGWKQVHASPQHPAMIFLAKLATVLVALVQLFLVVNVGLYLAGALPGLLKAGVGPWPGPFHLGRILWLNATCYLECLPIVAIQFLLGWRFRTFLVPVGTGVASWILSLVLINTKWNLLVPFNYTGIDYLVATGHLKGLQGPVGLPWLSCVLFVLVTLASLALFLGRGDKG